MENFKFSVPESVGQLYGLQPELIKKDANEHNLTYISHVASIKIKYYCELCNDIYFINCDLANLNISFFEKDIKNHATCDHIKTASSNYNPLNDGKDVRMCFVCKEAKGQGGMGRKASYCIKCYAEKNKK